MRSVESDQLEQDQIERMVRRNNYREKVRKTYCRSCGSRPGQPCVSPGGRSRVHNHQVRKQDALDAGLVKPGQFW